MHAYHSGGTAILFFARSAGAESRVKVFTERGRAANEAVAASLLRRGRSIAEATGLPTFHFTEREQHGVGFGEKLSNALKDVYALGYESIIALGSDCPGLRRADLTATLASLQAGETVLGPTRNGGVYLLGMHRRDFESEKFADLAWQASTLFQELRNYFGEEPIRLLSRRSDVNGARQLMLVLSLLSRTEAVRELLVILASCANAVRNQVECLLPADFCPRQLVCRPPPVVPAASHFHPTFSFTEQRFKACAP